MWTPHAYIILNGSFLKSFSLSSAFSPLFLFPRTGVYKPQRDRYLTGVHTDDTMHSEVLHVFNPPNVSHMLDSSRIAGETLGWNLSPNVFPGVAVCCKKQVRSGWNFWQSSSCSVDACCRKIVRFEYVVSSWPRSWWIRLRLKDSTHHNHNRVKTFSFITV